MPIEFRCDQCNKLLRTPDGTAGKQAKCPECGAIVEIPAVEPPSEGPPSAPPGAGSESPPGRWTPSAPRTGSPFAPSIPPPADFSDTENPYESPADYTVGAGYVAAPGAFVPTVIDIGDIFSRTWTIFKQQWLMCLAAMMIVWVISQAAHYGAIFGAVLVGETIGEEAVAFVLWLLSQFGSQLFTLWITIGQWLFFLKIARGEEASLGEIFRGGPYFLTVLLAGLLVMLIYIGGLLLLIIPGIIFGLMFSQFYYLILDRNVGVMESLRLSKQITYGNKLSIFALYLLGGLVVLGGLLACCVGVLVAAPFVALMPAVMYLAMTGQPTADQRYRQLLDRYRPGAAPPPFAAPTGTEA